MSLIAFILVFISVFMHASWNFLSKKDSPTLAFFWLSSVAGGVFWTFFAIFSGVDFWNLPWQFWVFWLLSNGFEVLYALSLAHGYKHGDISLVYPLGRSLPVLFIAVITSVFGLGKQPSGIALAGMVVIFCGCIIMPLGKWGDFKLKTYCNPVLFWVLMIGIGTTGYTLFDSMATGLLQMDEISGRNSFFKAVFYIFLVQLGLSLSLLVPAFVIRKEREELKVISKTFSPYIAGIFCASAYALVLLAMKFVTNVSFIQAFRQMSLPIGVLAGVFILKEKCSVSKIVGIVMVVAGLIMTSL